MIRHVTLVHIVDIRELSSPPVDQSVRCPVRELAIRELTYPRVSSNPFVYFHP